MLANHPQPKRLRELLPRAQFFPAAADPVGSAIRFDAAAIEPGDLYVHRDEFDSTGAEWAAQRGAAAVITERLLPPIDAPQVVVEDLGKTQGVLIEAFTKPLEHLPIIAVAGSHGPDTTATLLATIHAAACVPVGLLTETCEDDGEHCRPTPPGRRSKAANAAWLNRCRLGGVSSAIVSATPATSGDRSLRPAAACLNNLRCDALNERGERVWPSVVAHRAAIVASLGELSAVAPLAVNADDPECVAFASVHNGPVVTFGDRPHADLHATPLATHGGGQEFIVTHNGDSACVAARRPGAAYRSECLAAIATAVALGFDLQTAVDGVRFVPEPQLSVEPLVCGQSFGVMLDRSMRPNALRSAMEAAASTTDGRLIVALRLADEASIAHEQLAAAAAMSDRVFATGGPLDGVALPAGVTLVEDRTAALAVALGLADDGDAVLLAGCEPSGDNSPCRDASIATGLIQHRLDCSDSRAAA